MQYLTGSLADQYTAAARQKYATDPSTGYNPNLGVRVIDGVVQTGHYKKSTPTVSSTPSPPSSGGGGDSDTPDTPPVQARRAWTDYVTDDMDMSKAMDKYTSQDSPLMIAAETAAKRQQGQLGLLNTQGTISAVQNNMFNTAVPLASADVDRATSVALAQMGDDLQRDVASANITSANQQVMAKIWGDLVNTQLATMGAGINKGTWSQTGQTNMENVINSAGSAFSGFLNVPLS